MSSRCGVRPVMVLVAVTWAGTWSCRNALAIPFGPDPVGTHIFGQVAGNPTPQEVRFESPTGFSGVLRHDSVSAGGGTASATASLGMGALKGFAASPTDPVMSEIAHATAQFADQILIQNADGSAITGPVQGTIRMHMGGSLTLDFGRSLANGGNDAVGRLDLQVEPIQGATHFDTDAAIAINTRVGAGCPVADCVIDTTPLMSVSQDVAVDFIATPAVDVIGWQATLDVRSSNIAVADIAASLSVELPVGFKFTSASGVLLTIPPCAPGTDADGDGICDAADNCPYAANVDQFDRGGIGAGAGPDGIGDACQCGDVNGDGSVTLADAVTAQRSLLQPPTATLAHPELCDVGATPGCTLADAVILRRALLSPPTATIQQVCAPAKP